MVGLLTFRFLTFGLLVAQIEPAASPHNGHWCDCGEGRSAAVAWGAQFSQVTLLPSADPNATVTRVMQVSLSDYLPWSTAAYFGVGENVEWRIASGPEEASLPERTSTEGALEVAVRSQVSEPISCPSVSIFRNSADWDYIEVTLAECGRSPCAYATLAVVEPDPLLECSQDVLATVLLPGGAFAASEMCTVTLPLDTFGVRGRLLLTVADGCGQSVSMELPWPG